MKKAGQWTPDLLKEHYDERISALEVRLDGFPQEYLSEMEGDELRKTLETIRADHVQRRELAELRDAVELLRADYVSRREIEEMKSATVESTRAYTREFDKAAGSRRTWGLSGAIVLAVLTLLYGASYKSQLTHGDVSSQIQSEAPWAQDRPAILKELQTIERRQQAIEDQLGQVQALNRFFCRTRQPTLPAC